MDGLLGVRNGEEFEELTFTLKHCQMVNAMERKADVM